jgi:hypothetical protein
MKKLATMMVLLVAVGAAADLLVRVDFAAGLDARAVAASGVDVLFAPDGWCLARGDDAGVARLAEQFRCTVLDRDPATKRYVFVFARPGFDRARLAEFGSPLTADETGVLLRTSEDGVLGLNRLPVELYAISMRPLDLGQTLNSKPKTLNERAPSDSLIWTLVNRVSQDSLEARLRRIVAFGTRYATTESCRSACDWMRGQLATYGCDSTYLDTFTNAYAPNVVGIRTGKVNPRHVFAVTGHIDNTSESPLTFAPGSDDNASGSGLVIEAARVFQDVDFENTVWFVGFSAEEQGLVGSDSFVYACRQRGDSIIAAFHSDMISYGRDDSLCVVHTTALPQTESLARFFLEQADTFTSLQAKDTVVNEARSDHYSFWKYGYLAIRGRFHDETPMYHTTGDTIGPFHYANCGTNNMPLYTEMVKAAVATVAKWAGASPRAGVAEAKLSAHSLRLTASPTVFRHSVRLRLEPANPRTREPVDVSVYDASGRLVRVLSLPRPPTPDPYSLTWDCRDIDGRRVGPGVYLFRLTGSDGSAPAKAILAE